MTWDLYEDMDELLNGALATGKAAFHPGQQTAPNDSDSSDGGHDSGESTSKADDEGDFEEKTATEEEIEVSVPARAPLSTIKVRRSIFISLL